MKYLILSLAIMALVNAAIPKFWIKGYMKRWHIFPRNKSRWLPNVYLHKFTGNDDRWFHNHQWDSWSVCLWGATLDTVMDPDKNYQLSHKTIRPLTGAYFRPSGQFHRVTLISKSAWTLFITGPVKQKDWFFIDPDTHEKILWSDMDESEARPTYRLSYADLAKHVFIDPFKWRG